MKQFWTIFRFEFKNYAKSKAFLILTLLLAVGAGVALSFPRIQAALHTGKESAPQEVHTVALADRTGGDANASTAFFTAAMKGTTFKAVNQSLDDLKKAVDQGTYESAVILDSDLHYIRVVKMVSLRDSFESQFSEVLLARYRGDSLVKLGVPQSDAQRVLTATVKADTVQTASGKDQMKNFFYTYILIFALYMAILLYGQFVATSVATEKSTRAMELLITSTEPNTLMFGKVFGAGLAGLTQFVLIFGSGYLFYNVNKGYFEGNPIVQSIFNMPLSILLYVILFFVLGFFLYAFLYGALGSLVSRMEELSTTVMPVTMLFIVAFFIVMFSMTSGDVDNLVMKICSFIPFTSPMAMFVRIAMGNVAAWEIIVSVAVLIASTAGVGVLAAAVYRMGVLLYGKTPKLGEIMKMLRNSK